jgi:hypothetical protein
MSPGGFNVISGGKPKIQHSVCRCIEYSGQKIAPLLRNACWQPVQTFAKLAHPVRSQSTNGLMLMILQKDFLASILVPMLTLVGIVWTLRGIRSLKQERAPVSLLNLRAKTWPQLVSRKNVRNGSHF